MITNDKTMTKKELFKGMLLISAICFGLYPSLAQPVRSDHWAATDALGRKVHEYRDTADKRKDKFVAMFYWTWHQGIDDTTYQVKNITEIVRKYPEAMKIITIRPGEPNNPGSFTGNNHCLAITKQPIPGCCANMPKCWPMPGLMPCFLTVPMEVSPGANRTKH
jgi:hypothetical protein